MPGGELEPIGSSGPALADVAAELSEIFEQAGLSLPEADLPEPSEAYALRSIRTNVPIGILVTAAAIGLVGFGSGALVIRALRPPAPAHVKVAQPQALPFQPRPASPVTPPIALAEAAPTPAVEPAPAAEPAPAPAAAPAPKPAVAPPHARTRPAVHTQAAAKASSAAPRKNRSAESRDEFHHKLARLDELGPASAGPAVRRGAPAPVAQPASCVHDAESEDCRRAVIQADRHLREVYQDAFERGVPRRVLVEYRDRWAVLRVRNNDDPVRLIENYGALAYDLRRESADDQDHTPRPKHQSGLKALSDLLLPWW
jgi:hypothetical protein